MAKEIITMSSHVKKADAVVVKDGRIIDVGNSNTLLKRFKADKGLNVDRTFAKKILTPGLIAPHLHFWLFALVSNAHFITPADWQLPWGDVKGVVGEKVTWSSKTGHFVKQPFLKAAVLQIPWD